MGADPDPKSSILAKTNKRTTPYEPQRIKGGTFKAPRCRIREGSRDNMSLEGGKEGEERRIASTNHLSPDQRERKDSRVRKKKSEMGNQ